MTITIVFADDHSVVRGGLRAALSAEADFRVIGEAKNGLEALALTTTLRPDVLILDLAMPEMGGLEVISMLKKRRIAARVVVLTMHARNAYAAEALKSGASAYVLKDSDTTELVMAIRQAMQGKRFLSLPLTLESVEAYLEKTLDDSFDSYDTLTIRERQTLRLAAEGKSNLEIATQLVLSERTVEVHRANLMRKLDLHGQAELTRYAIRKGILPIDE